MKALLEALKTELKNIDGVEVFVTPDENFLPLKVRLPAIGIKDGPITRSEGVSLTMDAVLEVRIVAWVALAKPEATILGDASSGQIGVMALADAIHARLDNNLLGIGGVVSAFSSGEAGSVMMDTKNDAMQQKVIVYNYETEGDRPCTTS